MLHRIAEILSSFQQCRILVIGDLILDQYSFGSVSRISPEAPIQIFDLGHEEFRLGGAANVAHNLVALHAQVGLAGMIGDDPQGKILSDLARTAGIETSGIIIDSARPTTIKTRLICQGHHLLRTDREKRDPISNQLCRTFLSQFETQLDQYDAVIISDYAKGLLSQEFCQTIITVANQKGKKVMVGPKGKDWHRYSNSYVLSANRLEIETVSGIPLKDKSSISKAGRHLLEQLQLQGMLITLGAEGMYLVTKDEEDIYLPAQAKEVFDVVGAGDTVLSMMSLALTAHQSWKTSITLANIAAGIVVGKVGVVTVAPQELFQAIHSSPTQETFQDKIKTLAQLKEILSQERQEQSVKCNSNRESVVLTWGIFSKLGIEHIQFLSFCKQQGDILVVGAFTKLELQILSHLTIIEWVLDLTELPDIANILTQLHPDCVVHNTDELKKLAVLDLGKHVRFIAHDHYPVSQ